MLMRRAFPWPPPPPMGHLNWATVEEPAREPLEAWQDRTNAWLKSGSWWTRWRRRRDPWVRASIATAIAHGATLTGQY